MRGFDNHRYGVRFDYAKYTQIVAKQIRQQERKRASRAHSRQTTA